MLNEKIQNLTLKIQHCFCRRMLALAWCRRRNYLSNKDSAERPTPSTKEEQSACPL